MQVAIRSQADLRALLTSGTRRLSPAQRRLARFILANHRKVCFMTSLELGRAAGVSQATVVRFAGLLGYEGYPHFKRALQDLVRSELTATDRLQFSFDTSGAGDGFGEVIAREQENAAQLLATLRAPDLAKAVDRIAAAPCVIVVGLRAAACLAAYLGFFLAKVHPHVLTVTEGGSTVYDRLLHRRPEDTLVVALGFPRYPREILELLRFLRARRFPVIGITDRAASPLASMVDLLLIAPVELITLFDSYACPMILLNVLVNEVGKRDLGRTGRMLEAFEVMAQEVDTFSQAPPRRAQEGIPHGGRPGRGPR